MGVETWIANCSAVSHKHKWAIRRTVGDHNKYTKVEEEAIMFCHHCDDSLAGHRYVLRDDHPYCIKCYENVFANNCDECGKIIGIDSKDLSYKEDIICPECAKKKLMAD